MSSYQYRKYHCGDKTVVRSSYLHNEISYTGKMSSLYRINPPVLNIFIDYTQYMHCVMFAFAIGQSYYSRFQNLYQVRFIMSGECEYAWIGTGEQTSEILDITASKRNTTHGVLCISERKYMGNVLVNVHLHQIYGRLFPLWKHAQSATSCIDITRSEQTFNRLGKSTGVTWMAIHVCWAGLNIRYW